MARSPCPGGPDGGGSVADDGHPSRRPTPVSSSTLVRAFCRARRLGPGYRPLRRGLRLGSQPAHLEPSFTARVAVLGAAASFLVLVCLRAAYSSWLRASRARGIFCRRVCVFGVNEEAEALVDLLHGQPELGYRVVGVAGRAGGLGRPRCLRCQSIGPGVDAAVRSGAGGGLRGRSSWPARWGRRARRVGATVSGSRRARADLDGNAPDRPLAGCGSSPLAHQVMFYVERPKLSWWQSRPDAHDRRGPGYPWGSSVAAPCSGCGRYCHKARRSCGPIIYRQERDRTRRPPVQAVQVPFRWFPTPAPSWRPWWARTSATAPCSSWPTIPG